MPRFVLLHHECPTGYTKPSHWDFMLEFDGVLWTWELHELPAPWRGEEMASVNEAIVATRLADHRIEYLDYEGPLSGKRGSVSRVDKGDFSVVQHTPEKLIAQLNSKLCQGTVQLTAADQPNRWELRVSD
jgi:hypothetical protein